MIRLWSDPDTVSRNNRPNGVWRPAGVLFRSVLELSMPDLNAYALAASVPDRDRPAPPPGLAWLDDLAIPGQVAALESLAAPGLDWWALCEDGCFAPGPQASPLSALAAGAMLAEAARLVMRG
jgi:hypothetical protein